MAEERLAREGIGRRHGAAQSSEPDKRDCLRNWGSIPRRSTDRYMPGRAREKLQPGLGWRRLSPSSHGVECPVLKGEMTSSERRNLRVGARPATTPWRNWYRTVSAELRTIESCSLQRVARSSRAGVTLLVPIRTRRQLAGCNGFDPWPWFGYPSV